VPAIYDVTVHVQRGSETIASERREIGFKPLGGRGQQFIMAGKNWVLRGVTASSTTARLPREWHDASAAYVTDRIDDERLSEASQWGALALVHVESTGNGLAEQLRTLSRYPGAALAVVRGEIPADFNRSSIAPNLLLAQEMTSASREPAPWADVLLINAESLGQVASQTQKPMIAVRRLAAPVDLSSARAAYDVLQRDLAPLGQFAGYVV
jgi:hypothetical protein